MTLICLLLAVASLPLRGASDTFMDYQNYNHGYCPECNCFPCRCGQHAPAKSAPDDDDDDDDDTPPKKASCSSCSKGDADEEDADSDDAPKKCDSPDPCDPAAVCAINCGIGLCWLGLGIAVAATAAAIIIGSNNGSKPSH